MTGPFSLTGKVAVVSGGARGIGAASAAMLAQCGADVAIVDVLDTSEAVAAVTAQGRRGRGYAADLRDEEAVTSLFAHIVADFDGVDVVHNNAGTNVRVPAVPAVRDTYLPLAWSTKSSGWTAWQHSWTRSNRSAPSPGSAVRSR